MPDWRPNQGWMWLRAFGLPTTSPQRLEGSTPEASRRLLAVGLCVLGVSFVRPIRLGLPADSWVFLFAPGQFDLFLQLTFTPADNAPLVPPPLTLCKNLLELAFVAPFLPPTPLPLLTPPNSASTLQLPFPTDGLDGSTSTVNLLDVKQPYPSSRPSNASFSTPLVGSDGQSSKPLPMLPPDSSGHPPPSSSDARVVPEKFRDVSDKYLEAERRARTRRRDDGGGQDDEGEPPAYDG